MNLRNWRLRSKLAVVLAIPTLTALVLGGLSAQDKLSEAKAFDRTTAQVDFAGKVNEVVHQLQSERALSVTKIIVPNESRVQTALNEQIATVDDAVAALRDNEAKLDVTDPASKQRYDQGLERLEALTPLRAAVKASPYSEFDALNAYTSVIDSLVQLGREVTSAVSDRDVVREGTTLQAVSESKEFTSREDTALVVAAMRNGFTSILLDQIRAAQFSAQAALDLFRANATPAQVQAFTDTVSGPDVDGRARFAATALARAANNHAPDINALDLAAASGQTVNKLHAVETALINDLHARSVELADAATSAAWRDSAIVLAALLLAMILSVFVARLMLKPLRTLQNSALEIAYTRLPEAVNKILEDPDPVAASKNVVTPVPVTTREEIGEVARSFDAVHEQAIKMAAEQALLRENVNGIFVNLSRRSQRLVERQLGVIDRLEADEQDPDHLASLFELDHLATRLRRNGESLLVLSGAGLAKSVPKPVSAADVIGAAVSEIEQYARVDVGAIPDVAVRGLTVHDLVHLLAELLDNATYFSEPETKVSVRAVVTRRKALAIQITDRGVGMSEEQISEANKRLADPPDLDVSVTRRMGLYVVARLAQRHGIDVRLRENEDIEGGVIARIVVPAELLGAVASDVPLPAPQALNEISWPSAEPPVEEAPPEVPAQRPRPPSDAEQTAAGGLQPLDRPISLDDLVAGSSNAAFLSQGRTAPRQTPRLERQETFRDNGFAQPPAQFNPPELPKREPEYVPVRPPENLERPASESLPIDEDDIPTKRLPIYQSVVSRWFNAEGEPDLLGESRQAPSPSSEPVAEETPEQEPEQAEPQAEPAEPAVEEAVTEAAEELSWHSVADEGWQAARALLDKKSEEVTPAGLPKRVPNAYLVPGSVSVPEPGSFVDKTAGKPGQSAIARSATAARDRMVSFQRGYTSGRHALRDGTGENSFSAGGQNFPSSGRAVRSDE
ncbi:sensor histidine kinase [Amycolatopsis pigmentata]|uniref:histidine kinase n=1 Tax=Amycolatopsis pigmentata TaxID=450801 RepID=A0ABW5FTX9_9PSEU